MQEFRSHRIDIHFLHWLTLACWCCQWDIYHRQIKGFLGRRRDEGVMICWLILHLLSATIFFHPKASAESSLLYNYTISVPASSEPHQQLASVELFWEAVFAGSMTSSTWGTRRRSVFVKI